MVFSILYCCHSSLFRLYQQNKSSESNINFKQASNHYKRVLEAAKLAYATKTKESISSQKLGSWDFWQIVNSICYTIPPLFNAPKVLSSASDKAKLFDKKFSRYSNLDDSSISLPVFPSKTYLKLYISITPKTVKKVITNLDSSKASGPDCIPVVVSNNWAWTFIHTSWTLQKSLVFQTVGRSHRWSLYFRMLRKGLRLKTTALLVFFLRLVKSLKNLQITGLLIT